MWNVLVQKVLQTTNHTRYIKLSRKQIITYFEFSGIIVDMEGLNIRSRIVSMNVLGPACQPRKGI